MAITLRQVKPDFDINQQGDQVSFPIPYRSLISFESEAGSLDEFFGIQGLIHCVLDLIRSA